jgi:hypothetical protein
MYHKRKAAELEHLLKLRGLPTGGTKTEMLARLVNQDHEADMEAKATQAGIAAASNNARAIGNENQPQRQTTSSDLYSVRTTAGNGTLNKSEVQQAGKNLRSRAGVRSTGQTRKNAKEETEDGSEVLKKNAREAQDTYIKSLVAGQDHKSQYETGAKAWANPYPEIVVKMTPAAKKTAHNTWVTTGPKKQVQLQEPKLGFYRVRSVILVILLIIVVAIAASVIGLGYGIKSVQHASAAAEKVVKKPIGMAEEIIWGTPEPKSLLEIAWEKVVRSVEVIVRAARGQ